MKRSQRALHRMIWLILAPFLGLILAAALFLRPGEPVNDTLPASLTMEARYWRIAINS